MFSSNTYPGTILDVSHSSDSFVIEAADGSILITHWDADPLPELSIGQYISSEIVAWDHEELQRRYGGIPESEWEIRPAKT